ncbi:hypothetical protein [Bradyrhizobium sp. AZCC 1693]|uniref:hypothetical protein n=1 Tax=Bradyrhizobium sp. AZCC 1693 TaxID=3117029 RepID=UPI002FF0C524
MDHAATQGAQQSTRPSTFVTQNHHIQKRGRPLYGDFDCIASRFDEREAWVLHDDWVQLNSVSVNNAVRELTKEQFDRLPQRLREASRQGAARRADAA